MIPLGFSFGQDSIICHSSFIFILPPLSSFFHFQLSFTFIFLPLPSLFLFLSFFISSFLHFFSLSFFLFSYVSFASLFHSIGRLISFRCVGFLAPNLACGAVDSVPAGAALVLAWRLVLSQYTRKDDVVSSLRFQSRSNVFFFQQTSLAFPAVGRPAVLLLLASFFFTQVLS